jgi:hypothetical protein
MSDQYSEHDTERVRQAERSSAGVETQHLSLPSGGAGYGGPAAAASSLPAASGRPNMLGLGLIGAGALLLLGRLAALQLEIEAGMILLTIASVFFFFGFWRHIYGLVIPGSILAGLSVGVTFADVTNGVSVLWGLALGFLAIYTLGTTMFRMGSQWPIYPAVILFAVGTIVAIASVPFFNFALIGLPLLLIGAGLYLGWMRRTA